MAVLEGNFNFNSIHIVRGLQGLLSILTLGLLAHVAQWYNSNPALNPDTKEPTAPHVPNQIAFSIFVSVFTLLLTLPYTLLTPRYFPTLLGQTHTKHSLLAFESTTMILWFASFVSVAAFLGQLETCRGDVCGAAKAGCATAAFAWVSWAMTALFALRFCCGVTGQQQNGIEKGERKRERLVRTFRHYHGAWAGRGSRRDDGPSVTQTGRGGDVFGVHGGGRGYQWEVSHGDNRI